MEGIFEPTVSVLYTVEPPHVRLVVAEEERRPTIRGTIHIECVFAELNVTGQDRAVVLTRQLGLRHPRLPQPFVAEPELREHVEHGRLRTAVVDGNEHQDVVGAGLGVLDEDVEIAVAVEDAGVEDLEFRVLLAAAAVLLHQAGVRKFRLWIFIEHLEIGARRRGVEVVVELLDVLAVVPLAVGEAEQALFQDRIATVPERQSEAELLLVVAEAGEAVFPPAVDAAAGVIVREIVPRGAVRAVVLADGAPLALAQIRPPEPPVAHLVRTALGEALVLGGLLFHLSPPRKTCYSEPGTTISSPAPPSFSKWARLKVRILCAPPLRAQAAISPS
jgi:hypothetical protein